MRFKFGRSGAGIVKLDADSTYVGREVELEEYGRQLARAGTDAELTPTSISAELVLDLGPRWDYACVAVRFAFDRSSPELAIRGPSEPVDFGSITSELAPFRFLDIHAGFDLGTIQGARSEILMTQRAGSLPPGVLSICSGAYSRTATNAYFVRLCMALVLEGLRNPSMLSDAGDVARFVDKRLIGNKQSTPT